MSDDEVDELLKAVDTSSGEINYTGMSCFFLLCVYLEGFSVTDMSVELVRTILAN